MKNSLKLALGSLAVAGLALTVGCPFIGPKIPTGDVANGETLWDANACLTCHGPQGCGGSGPSLRTVTYQELDATLRAAESTHTGGTQTGLSKQEVADLVAFLNSVTEADCALSEASKPSKTADFTLIATHDPASSKYNSSCTTCHGERTRESALDGATLAVHAVMLGSLGSGADRCLTCHGGAVDLIFNSHVWLRQDMMTDGSCASSACHGRSGAVPFYMVDQ